MIILTSSGMLHHILAASGVMDDVAMFILGDSFGGWIGSVAED